MGGGGGNVYLDEESLCDRSASAQGGSDIERAGKHARDNGRGCNAAKQLRDDDEAATQVRYSADNHHAKGYLVLSQSLQRCTPE